MESKRKKEEQEIHMVTRRSRPKIQRMTKVEILGTKTKLWQHELQTEP